MSDVPFEPAAFASEFQAFLYSYARLVPAAGRSLKEVVTEHFGIDPTEFPSVAMQLEPTDLPNLQLGLEALDPEWQVHGLPGELRHYAGLSLATVLSGRFGMPAGVVPVEYVQVAVDVDETLPCVPFGVYLGRVEDVPIGVLVAMMENGPRASILVDVLTADRDVAARFLDRLKEAIREHNVYRGKVLSFSISQWGRFELTFHRIPTLDRDDVVLPEADLNAIERHTVGIALHAEVLRAAGRHLKRGLLLYGPPGTGKTLSVMYLCNRMPGRTTLLLTGPGESALGQAAAIARALQPSMIVLEDVDLVAMERTLPGMQNNPLLFQLLNEMDGLAEDADVIFVLTTNRVELLEPALIARPGRIDQAVEIKLPDGDARRRLFELYLRDAGEVRDLDDLISRTEGVSASFIKELVRRAVLVQAELGVAAGEVAITAADLSTALDDLLDRASPVTHAALGGHGRNE